MIPDSKNLYLSIHEYIYHLVRDRDVSLRLVNVFTRAEVPLQTFITAAKLYGIILNRAEYESERSANEDPKAHRKDCSFEKSKLIGRMSAKLIRHPYPTFISCCVISSKFYKDIAFNNESWGCVACLSKNEINDFERITLGVLDYKINSAGDGTVMSEVQTHLRRSGFDASEVNPKIFNFGYLMKKLFCFK